MVVNMTHNEKVKTFEDIVRRLELEAERLVAYGPIEQAYVAEISTQKKLVSSARRGSLRRTTRNLMTLRKEGTEKHAVSTSV